MGGEQATSSVRRKQQYFGAASVWGELVQVLVYVSSQGGAARQRRRDRACVLVRAKMTRMGQDGALFEGGVSVSAGGRPLFMRSPAGGLAN